MSGAVSQSGRKSAVHQASGLAARPEVREALGWFARERRWIDEQHLELCRVPAPTFREDKRAAWFLSRFKDFGWQARLDRAGNVTALPAGDPGGPLVAITAHLDTVLAPEGASAVRLEAGRFRGAGVADNGPGLAALLALARLYSEFPGLAGETPAPLLAANVCEEGEGNLSGMRYLCRQSPLVPRLAAFLVLDGPATDHITAEALACRRFEIQLTGPGGHSWSDHGTVNPVHALSRAISDFVDLRWDSPDATPRCSYNFGVVEGGSTVNSIPSAASARADLRSEDPALLDEMAAQLTRTVEHAVTVENDRASGGRLAARIRETGSRPGGRLPEGSPLLEAVRGVDEFLGIRSSLDCASTDANVPLSLGLPAVSLGAGGQGGGAHTPGEWYSSEGRDLGLRRLLLTHLLLARTAGPV
jgi:acetylornithine deacetylase/succinyl-diaminopimelate desuccinylase-like protein